MENKLVQKKPSLTITDTATGEVISIEKATPMQVSGFLSIINKKRRDVDKIEKTIKNWIKTNVKMEFDDANHFEYGQHRITRTLRQQFNEDRFRAKGDPKLIKIYDKIKNDPQWIDMLEIIKI